MYCGNELERLCSFTLQNQRSHISHLRIMESCSQIRSSGKLEGGKWLAHRRELGISHTAVNHMSKPDGIIANTVTHLPRVGEWSFKVWPFKYYVLCCGQNTFDFKWLLGDSIFPFGWNIRTCNGISSSRLLNVKSEMFSLRHAANILVSAFF